MVEDGEDEQQEAEVSHSCCQTGKNTLNEAKKTYDLRNEAVEVVEMDTGVQEVLQVGSKNEKFKSRHHTLTDVHIFDWIMN